jgi:hypothetical protein
MNFELVVCSAQKPWTNLALRLALSPNRPKRAITWASSSRSTIGCVQNDFWAYGTFGAKPCTYRTPILTLSLNGPKLDSIWPTSPRCLSSVSKTIFKPMVRSSQAVHLSCSNTKTLQMDRNEIPHDPGHLGVLSGVSKVIFEPLVRSAQTVHLSCVKNSTISKRTETSIHLSLVT